MDLRISHSCPSCGGPVEMQEADRLTDCPYCGVKNYLVANGMLRFVLPDILPAHIDRADIIHFPYLRFKGNIFSCAGTQVGCKVLDTTHQGVASLLLPPSLGLRPQAMQVHLVDEQAGGTFVRQTQRPATVLQHAERLTQAFSGLAHDRLHHRAFIGETVSCLYLPLYVDNGELFDATLQRPLGSEENWLAETDSQKRIAFSRKWRPRYLAMICPECGDSMQGQPDSLVVHCYNCDSCWSEEKGRFVPVPYSLVEAHRLNCVYLPFWRIGVESTGVDMNTFGDLLRVANQPVVVGRKHHQHGLEFWIPAIKIRPRVFLTLAKGATLSQLKYPGGEAKLNKALEPVTLPLKEAVQAIKPVFAETVVSRKDILPRLVELKFSVHSARLTFLPFQDTGHDLVQIHSALSVASSVVRHGRNL